MSRVPRSVAEIRSRVATSERVRTVTAAAIAYSLRRVHGQEVPWPQAMALAATGSVRAVLARFEDQRRVRRAMPGLTPDRDFQQRLALLEVAADVSGAQDEDPEARRALIRDAMDQEATLRRAAGSLERVADELERLRAALEAAGSGEREFVRRANRLRGEQVARLREAINDAAALELALSRLDTVYQRHLALGLNLSGVSTDLPAEVKGPYGE
jgi:Na+-transporting methylmalonyl-CoA/oxaloacetate decarboxylase gamma subunit